MQYFPFFTDIEEKRCLIVGGGKVALRKAQKLLPFRPRITVIAEDICGEFSKLSDIVVIKKSFQLQDIGDAFMVIAATDDLKLNHEIYEFCVKQHILINSVDDRVNCSFIFPAIIKRENFTVAVSTAGKSPLYARYLREKIENAAPDDSDEIIGILSSCRIIIKEKVRTEEKRKAVFEMLLRKCIQDKDNIDIDKIIEEAGE